ncbi:MAG: ABC transporter substrate-binding protein [Acidimicrobiia bacterium]
MLLALLLLAAACGSDDGSSGTSGSSDGDGGAADEGPAGEGEGERPDLGRMRLGTGIGTPVLSIATPFVLPAYLGFWEDEGLDVVLAPTAGGSGANIESLEAGQLELAHFGLATLPKAIDSGIDLVAFFVQARKNYHWPVVPLDSPIEEPADLVGKTIGVQSLTAAAVDYGKAYIERAGGDPNSIDFVGVGTGADAGEALKAGHVDALIMWAEAYIGLENAGYEFREVRDPYLDRMGFQTGTVGLRSFVEDPANRPAVVALARGMAKAMVFATERPDCTVKALWDLYPESRPTGVPEEEALARGVEEVESRNSFSQPDDDERWGDATDEEVGIFLEVMSSSLGVDDVWTSEFIEEINDFDHDAVREMAKDYDC